MMRHICLLACALAFSACAKPPEKIASREDYVREATRTYQGETRERVIKAAEIVLKNSDGEHFEFRYTVDGFVGLRRYFMYAVIASSSGRERWEFETRQTPGAIE